MLKYLGRIRHYGLYAGAGKDARHAAQEHLVPKARVESAPVSTRSEQLREITGRDVHHCPHCGDATEHRPVPARIGRAPPLKSEVAA